MSVKKEIVTGRDVAAFIAANHDLSKAKAEEIVKDVFAVIVSDALEGKKVQLTKFGIFEVQDKSARVGRNPQTGEEVQIPARRVIKFKAAKALKDEAAGV